MWNSTAEDPTRATRRAAEFLVHQAMPWSLIRALVTRTEAAARLVQDVLSAAKQERGVTVRPGWYYNGNNFL